MNVWLATLDEAETVGMLLVRFRDHMGRDWPSDNAILAGVERLMEQSDTDYLLAAPDADSPPAGVCQLRFRWGIWWAAPDCLLEDLYVGDEVRGQGMGSALVAAALDRARERGCRRVELDVNEANAPALALYERQGFSSVPPGEEARNLFMRHHLAQPD